MVLFTRAGPRRLQRSATAKKTTFREISAKPVPPGSSCPAPITSAADGDQRRAVGDDIKLSDIEPQFVCSVCGICATTLKQLPVAA